MSFKNLKYRFKSFAINNAVLIKALPQSVINNAYSRQLIRSVSSARANYSVASRAKSPADFIKIKIVGEETDGSLYFLELVQHFNSEFDSTIEKLLIKGKELLAYNSTVN